MKTEDIPISSRCIDAISYFSSVAGPCDNVNMMREELDMNNIDIVDMDILRDEALAAEVAIADFEATVGEFIEAGAGDRETALRWMTMEETDL